MVDLRIILLLFRIGSLPFCQSWTMKNINFWVRRVCEKGWRLWWHGSVGLRPKDRLLEGHAWSYELPPSDESAPSTYISFCMSCAGPLDCHHPLIPSHFAIRQRLDYRNQYLDPTTFRDSEPFHSSPLLPNSLRTYALHHCARPLPNLKPLHIHYIRGSHPRPKIYTCKTKQQSLAKPG